MSPVETEIKTEDILNLPDVSYLKRPEDLPEEKSVESSAWYAINEYLSTHETYAPNSSVTQYLQESLDFLSDGVKIEVVIAHDEEPNGFAMPGYIVATDGLVKILESQEELDAFLAHEY